MLRQGEVLGGTYQVVREIGKGGVGIIYLGYHLRLQTDVVIKKIKESVSGRVNVRQEADILKRLHHTYLPQVYDFLSYEDGIYTVMEYIPGENLQYYIDQGYTFPEQTIRVWLTQLLEVLSYLHTRDPKILHCDIKPANIMVRPDWNLCLIDFNVSLDGSGAEALQGISSVYAAPEQYLDAQDVLCGRPVRFPLDERMDLYSLGAVCYRLMTGYEPDAQKGLPVPLEALRIPYSDALKSIVSRALSWDVRRRYASAAQMYEALQTLVRSDPRYRHLRRLRILTAFGGAAAVLLGAFLMVTGWNQYTKGIWTDRYNAFCVLSEGVSDEETAAEVAQEGLLLLDDDLLQGVLSRNPEEKAKICYAIADSYYYREMYENAANYYLEALETDPQSVYLRDYLTACIRDGQEVDLTGTAADYEDLTLEAAELYYLQAQVSRGEGETQEAIALCAEALTAASEEGLDAAFRAQICLLQAELYAAEGADEDAARAAGMAVSCEDTPQNLRTAAGYAFAAGSAASEEENARTWYETACSYYETLCAAVEINYTDQLNLALTYYALSDYEKSAQVLKTLASLEEYEETYEPLMWLCYCYVRIALRDGSLEEVADDLSFWYPVCNSRYLSSGETDEVMETLKDMVSQAEELL